LALDVGGRVRRDKFPLGFFCFEFVARWRFQQVDAESADFMLDLIFGGRGLVSASPTGWVEETGG
jgi:hypothetical protein